MTGQNYLVDFMSKTMSVCPEIKKLEFKKGNESNFNDILSFAVNKAPSDNKLLKKENLVEDKRSSIDREKDTGPQFRTFKEAQGHRREDNKISKTEPETGAATNEVSSTKRGEDASKKEKEVSKEKVAVESLAEIMGIPTQQLIKLLESIDIQPEALTDSSKVQEVVNKLSQVLNLSDDEKQALTEILNTLKTVVEEKAGELGTKAVEGTTKETQQQGLDGKQETSKSSRGEALHDKVKVERHQDVNELLAKFKASLQVLTQKLQENPQSLTNELSQKVGEVISDLKGQKTEATSITKETIGTMDAEDSILEAGTENQSSVKADNQEKPEPKNQNGERSFHQRDGKTDGTVLQSNNTIKTEQTTGTSLNQQVSDPNFKVSDIKEISKVHKETPVTKNEIIHQVIEKAKVTLTGDKSEMTMELKPESLGKLSLKVLTERGMVVAKFVAESQQVKETLEANMQLLKDSLEKQGLSVQGFSVSVQQDPHRGQPRHFEMGQGKEAGNGKNEAHSVGTVNAVGVLETQKKVNAYNWSDSSINLTA